MKKIFYLIVRTTLVQKLDSIKGVKPSDIVVSKVIHNSYNVHENYLTLNSGELEGIKPDMGVINSLGNCWYY
jgi:rod shape-determining protein MreC